MADMQVPHGFQVLTAARTEEGYKGPVLPSVGNAPSTDVHRQMEINKEIGAKPLKKEETLKLLTESVEVRVAPFLNDQSNYLEGMTKAGAKNSAANFSLGASKASVSANIFMDSSGSFWNPSGTKDHTVDNYARAFGVDADKLRSEDPKVHGPARRQLQQGIIDHVSGTMDGSKAVKDAQGRWTRAVEGFEAGKNSVVVSAGNEGDYAEQLQQLNGGGALRVPADFEKNLLETEAVTSVGATETVKTDGKSTEQRAVYSNVSGGVDIYANGTLAQPGADGKPVQGTSFAAPRVAATMAQLHRDHPNLSSSQVETLMKNQLGRQLNTGDGSVLVLDHQKNFEFLQNSKY